MLTCQHISHIWHSDENNLKIPFEQSMKPPDGNVSQSAVCHSNNYNSIPIWALIRLFAKLLKRLHAGSAVNDRLM